MNVLNLDCRHGLALLPDNSVDAIVCDPPYGLSFMGKSWDYDVPGVDIWEHCLRVLKPGGYLLAFAGTRTQHRMACRIEDAGFEIRDLIAWVYGSGYPKHRSALKPTLEPITMARKPAPRATLLNIDACRAGDRYPANLVHDGSPEVLDLFPDSLGSGGSVPNVKISGYGDGVVGTGAAEYLGGERKKVEAGSGSAARFFYCAKTSKTDRNEGLDLFPDVQRQTVATSGLSKHADGSPRNMSPESKNPHPTVKPTALMRYLCRLVTPPGGLIVDPFAGSGSTGKAAVLEGFQFVGFELDPQYTAIANARINAARSSGAC